MVFNIWCDQCGDWVDEVYINGQEVLCFVCDNRLLINLPQKEQKKLKIEIAKAIWNL